MIMQPAVLLVDDDPDMCAAIADTLELAGITSRSFHDAREALSIIDVGFAGLVLSDIRMPGMDGLEFAARIRAIDAEIPVILVSGHADVSMAVSALRDGASDVLSKPFSVESLLASIRRGLASRTLVLENRALRQAADHAIASDSPLLGESAAMVQLRDTVAQLARVNVDVLINGETGTGKELVATLLHRQGPRRARPFVAVNCGALPQASTEAELFGEGPDRLGGRGAGRTGLIQSADRGTFFLDEIDSMDLALQVKLLRVLEEREVLPLGSNTSKILDIRIIASSKRDLAADVRNGSFRQDLYYRLNVVHLRIPPLRERRADIPLLFASFVSAALEQTGIESFRMNDATRRHLIEHDWPGNVRELKNFAFSAVLNLPTAASMSDGAPAQTLPERLAGFEASILRETLVAVAGDVRAAIKLLGIPRKTFYHKLSRHGLSPGDFRTRD